MTTSPTSPSPADDRDHPLSRRLEALFDERSLSLDGSPVLSHEVVRRRATVRSSRRRATLAIASVAIIASATATWFNRDTPEQIRLADGRVGGGLPPLDWQLVDRFDPAGSPGRSASTADGVEYRLGTAPSAAGTMVGDEGPPPQPTQALLARRDGDWREVAQFDGYSLSDLTARGNDLYVVGTAATTRRPASTEAKTSDGTLTRRRPGTVVVRRSTDGGVTWSDVTLPVDLEAIFDAGGASGASLSIATSGDVVVAAVAITPMLQLSTLLPSPESNQFWQLSADGSGAELWGIPLDVAEAAVVSCPDGWSAGATWVPAQPQGEFSTAVGPNGETIEMVRCPSPNGGEPLDVSPESVRLQSKTWNELGLDQPPVGSSRVFRSTDGSSFEEVSVPWATPASDSSMSIAGASSGFTLIRRAFVPATPAPIIEAATSPDGSAWTLDTADAIPAFDWVRDLTILDDHPVTMGGRSDGTTTVLRREDTGAWTTIEPAKLLRGLASESETGVPVYYYSSVSESGIALLYGAGGEPPEESEDAGYRLQVDTSGNAVVSDRSGAEVGRLALVDGSAVEGALRYDAAKNTVQVLDTDGRTPLATLPVRAWQDPPRLRYLVWSPDGQRWGVEDLDAVTDGELSPNGVSMEAGRITIPLDGTTDDGTPVTAPGAPRRALVADLPR